MGLDCTAYSHLKFVGKHTVGFCQEEDEHGDWLHHQAFAYLGFEKSMDGLPIQENVFAGGSEFLYGGCYEETPETEAFRFRAGSYSGYNAWRKGLADLYNPYEVTITEDGDREWSPIDMDKPFAELIWFADNEGTIGPLAAARLLADFKEHQAEYFAHYPDEQGLDEWNRRKYEDWMTAFELASQDGLVSLH